MSYSSVENVTARHLPSTPQDANPPQVIQHEFHIQSLRYIEPTLQQLQDVADKGWRVGTVQYLVLL